MNTATAQANDHHEEPMNANSAEGAHANERDNADDHCDRNEAGPDENGHRRGEASREGRAHEVTKENQPRTTTGGTGSNPEAPRPASGPTGPLCVLDRPAIPSWGSPEIPPYDLAEGDVEALDRAERAVSREESRGRARLLLGRDTVDVLIGAVPGLAGARHRALLAHCLVSPSRSVVAVAGCERPLVRIGRGTLARLEGKEKELRGHAYAAEPFLLEHRALFPDFAFVDYKREVHPRLVLRDGLPGGLRALLDGDLRRARPVGGPLVDLVTGEEAAKPTAGRAAQNAAAAKAAEREQATMRAERAAFPLQTDLLRLLNGAPTNTVARLVNANLPAAHAVAEAIADPAKQLRALAALREVALDPAPTYAPSRRGRTPRVFAVATSFLGLPRAVRQALCAGCLEADLANAHLAIAAMLWGVDRLHDLLTAEGSVWPHLLAVVAGTHALDPRAAKRRLKKAVYSIVYGMSVGGLWKTTTERFSAEAARRLMGDPLIQRLLEARDRALSAIRQDGGARDCFGVWHAVAEGDAESEGSKGARRKESERKGSERKGSERKGSERKGGARARVEKGCRSVLAAQMQAFELLLLEPVIADAAEAATRGAPPYRVVAWQHDGFTVKSKEGSVERRLVRLVAEQARRLGVPTRLEVARL